MQQTKKPHIAARLSIFCSLKFNFVEPIYNRSEAFEYSL